MRSSEAADPCTSSTMCRWSVVSAVSRSNSMMPSNPLIGERISWLIIARKSDFARADRSASVARCAGSLRPVYRR